MCHSTWVKMCLAVRRLSHCLGVRPQRLHRGGGPGLVQRPLHIGELPQPRQQARLRPLPQGDPAPAAAAGTPSAPPPGGAFWPPSPADPPPCPGGGPGRSPAAGHSRHLGGPLGAQTVAPSSMVAWLKTPDVLVRLRHDGLDLGPDGLFDLGVRRCRHGSPSAASPPAARCRPPPPPAGRRRRRRWRWRCSPRSRAGPAAPHRCPGTGRRCSATIRAAFCRFRARL